MRDFHVRSLRQPIHPVAFGLQSGRVSFVLATMRPERMAETLKYIEDTESQEHDYLYFNVGVHWFDHYDQGYSVFSGKPYCEEIGCEETMHCTFNWGIKRVWDKKFIDGDWVDVESRDWIPGPEGSEWGVRDSHYQHLTDAIEDAGFRIHHEIWGEPPFSGKPSGTGVCPSLEPLFE